MTVPFLGLTFLENPSKAELKRVFMCNLYLRKLMLF